MTYKADPDSLGSNLPPRLTVHPSNFRMSMYRVNDPFETTNEPYSVTYLAIEVQGHDTTVVSKSDGPEEYLGRFFAQYWTSSLDEMFLKR